MKSADIYFAFVRTAGMEFAKLVVDCCYNATVRVLASLGDVKHRSIDYPLNII